MICRRSRNRNVRLELTATERAAASDGPFNASNAPVSISAATSPIAEDHTNEPSQDPQQHTSAGCDVEKDGSVPSIRERSAKGASYEYENGRPRLPGVPVGGVPLASSTPRPCERQVSEGPLLASAPGGVTSITRATTPLQACARGPLPPQDEASTLAYRAHTGRLDALGFRPPLKTIARVASRA